MTKLSKLWAMAYSNYIDDSTWATKNQIKEMEDTLLYWWTRASCDELKGKYNQLQQIIKNRERLSKVLNANFGQ